MGYCNIALDNDFSAPAIKYATLTQMKKQSALLNYKLIKEFVTDFKAGLSAKVLAILALVYLLLPTDIIPDIIPFLGWIDDAGALILSIAHLISELKDYKRSHDV